MLAGTWNPRPRSMTDVTGVRFDWKRVNWYNANKTIFSDQDQNRQKTGLRVPGTSVQRM